VALRTWWTRRGRSSERSGPAGVGEEEKLLRRRDDDLEKLIAISHAKRAAENGMMKVALVDMAEAIDQDINKFRTRLTAPPRKGEGVAA